MNPELRKRFVDSIDYLRKMDFFKKYSNLSSEEILDKIFNGVIDHPYSWWDEKRRSKSWRPRGVILKQSLVEYESDWMKSTNAEIDRALMVFETKRVMTEAVETMLGEGMGEAILEMREDIEGSFPTMNISSSKTLVMPEPVSTPPLILFVTHPLEARDAYKARLTMFFTALKLSFTLILFQSFYSQPYFSEKPEDAASFFCRGG